MSIRARLLWLAGLIVLPMACMAPRIVLSTCQRERDAVERTLHETTRAATAHERFDVALSEIVMPGGTDGIGPARRIRARWPELPIVFMPGYAA